GPGACSALWGTTDLCPAGLDHALGRVLTGNTPWCPAGSAAPHQRTRWLCVAPAPVFGRARCHIGRASAQAPRPGPALGPYAGARARTMAAGSVPGGVRGARTGVLTPLSM